VAGSTVDLLECLWRQITELFAPLQGGGLTVARVELHRPGSLIEKPGPLRGDAACNCEADGTFPNTTPTPANWKTSQELIAEVDVQARTIWYRTGWRCRSLGVVTGQGEMIYAEPADDAVTARRHRTRQPGRYTSLISSARERLPMLIRPHGRPTGLMWKSGHSLIKADAETRALLGWPRMSGHIFFKTRLFGFDDGLYSSGCWKRDVDA